MKKLKVGDVVFVVDQTRKHATAVMRDEVVARVGKKFGYIKRYGREAPFELATGRSSHKDNNRRSNCFGFDVYESRQEYERITDEFNEKCRLTKRLMKNSWSIVVLPPDAVAKIHAVLDEVEAKGAK